jgi:hypothetical protein
MLFDGARRWLEPADKVVLATGIEPDPGPWIDQSLSFERIGDAARIGDAKAAITAGYLCGSRL